MAADPAATAAADFERVDRTSALFVSAGENATTEVEKVAKRDERAVNTFIVVWFRKILPKGTTLLVATT